MSTTDKNEFVAELPEENIAAADGTVSLQDVIQEQEGLEEDAQAVLGGSDDANCTYDNGYVYRQALYSCLTCVPKTAPEPAGVCLACSLHCHDGHELVELYTKRNFRCDCGNGKFSDFVCRLCPNKDKANELNKYNHNFVGEYCTCNKPYPDPEDSIEDEMIQCVICEDWFHSRHLDSSVPNDDEYSEMACQSCIARCPFLRSYASLKFGDEDEKINGNGSYSNGTNDEEKRACKYFNMPVTASGKGTVYFMTGWRSLLCTCKNCKEMYDVHNCSFLTDATDPVEHYEEVGKVLHESGSFNSLENGMRALGQQDRVTQIEMVHGYNEMKEQLTNFLKTFAEKRKVVQQEDIYGFFNALKARKRQRTTPADTSDTNDQDGPGTSGQ